MIYYVYIIFSASLSRYYVGHTHELDKRIRDHNTGLNRSTKNGSPWELVKYFECESRSEVIALENRIKKRGIRRFLDDIDCKDPK
jgi:putative endonuclease